MYYGNIITRIWSIILNVILAALLLGLAYMLLFLTPLNSVKYFHRIINIQEVEYGDSNVMILLDNGMEHRYVCTPIDNSGESFMITRVNYKNTGFSADNVDYYEFQYSYLGRKIEIGSFCSELDSGTFDDYLKQCKNPINKFLCFIADLTDT